MKNGFTLIELLVVISIVGILAGLALPQFSEYRKRAYDTQALNDLRNVALAEEAYFLDNQTYLPCNTQACLTLPGIKGLSKGVTVSIATAAESFTGEASHQKGTGKKFDWDSNQGGLVQN